MRTWLPYALVASVGLLVAATADDLGKKMVDPVSNKEVTVAKETPTVIVNGNHLYFADAKNRDTFLKAPETYVTKTKLECPVKGFPIRGASKTNRVVVNDQIVYFCCGNCPSAFAKEPNNFLDKVSDPVSGKEFALTADAPKSTYKNGIYFFENADNKAAFEKEPAKYAKVVLQ
jgi:YHS domain-containing protein